MGETPLAHLVKKAIKEAIQRIYDRDINVKDDDYLELDLGLDSLDKIELLLDLETYFNIDIPEDVARNFSQVKDVINYLKKEIGDKQNE